MTLIDLTADAPHDYKSFFLNGLRQHRDKFRISPDDEINEPFPTQGTPDSFTLGLLTNAGADADAGVLAGVVSFAREGRTREKIRHKGLLFRMYVAPEYAGQGLGRQLLTEVIRRVRTQTDIEQINLTVVATNDGAKRLYQSLGFVTFAHEKNGIKDGDAYHAEEQMVLFL
jgi:ribosomal protein S18 acetylase RimI-like enzyme